MELTKTSEVFRLQREVPVTYVTRPAVDDVLVEGLTRDKHIVVRGFLIWLNHQDRAAHLGRHGLSSDPAPANEMVPYG